MPAQEDPDVAPSAASPSTDLPVPGLGGRDSIDDLREGWAAARPNLDTGPAATIGRMLRAARHVTILSDELLGRFGISRGEFDVLSALRRSPDALTPSDLARLLVTSNAAITKRMVQLEASGLAHRTRSAADRRVVQLSLTEAGRSRIDEALPEQLDFERGIEALLDDGQRDEFERALRVVLGELERLSRRP
jgi:DNA-binding MarR family transcriptional regulator